MNKLWILLFIPFIYAGTFVFHTGETITGKRESCGAVCSQRADALRVDIATYESTTKKYHKVVNDVVIEKSQAEIDVIVQAEADAAEQAILDAIDKYDISNVDLITALVQRINVRIPANPITKAELIQQIKDNR